jgi:cob(I)alamin adenosyltransferase
MRTPEQIANDVVVAYLNKLSDFESQLARKLIAVGIVEALDERDSRLTGT